MIFVIVLLILLAIGSGPYFPYSRGWGWGPSGLLWIVLVIAVVLLLTGVLGDPAFRIR
jgi:low affinity Fe/Cu permease